MHEVLLLALSNVCKVGVDQTIQTDNCLTY